MTAPLRRPASAGRGAPAVGVVFGSGGARGFAHLGAMRALRELGLEPALVVGTSIGSIAAAAWATGSVDAVEKGAATMNLLESSRMFVDFSLHRSGFTDGRGVMDRLRAWIPDLPIERLRTPFAAVATDLASWREVVLDAGSLHAAVRASISIPGVFTPVRRGDAWLVDGGLANPLPVSVARAMGAERVLAIDVNLGRPAASAASPAAGEEAAAPHLLSVLTRSLRVGENAIERERLRREAPDLLLSPPVGDRSTLDFRACEEPARLGYECAMARASDLRALFS